MKRIILLFAFFIYINVIFSQNSLRAYLDVKTFQTTKNESYIEVFNKINANSLSFIKNENKFISKLVINHTILKNDTIIIQKKDTLQSIVIDSIFDDIYTLKTFVLKEGRYKLKVDYFDLNNDKISNAVSNYFTFEIKHLNNNTINISNIQIADYINVTKSKNQFSKYGYDVFPHLGNYLSNECSVLPFYYEIYSKDKTYQKCKIQYKIINKDKNEEFYNYIDTTIELRGNLTPIINVIDIKQLPTGNYLLTINKIENKSEINSTFEFYRVNESITSFEKIAKILDPNFHKSLKNDSLTFFAKSLMPIMYNEDQKILLNLLKEPDTIKLRNFIESFWISTSSLNPYEEG